MASWRVLALCGLIPALTACATLVTDAPPAQYAPEGTSMGRSGTVVYNPGGLQDIVDMRRENAFKKIVEFCGSRRYHIDGEDTHEATEGEHAAASLATLGASDLHQIRFTCQ